MTGRRLRSVLSSAPLAALVGVLLWLATTAPGRAQAAAPASEGARAQESRGRSGPAPGGTWEWWNDASVQQEIGLTKEKAASIDDAYRRRSREMRAVIDQFVKESRELDVMTKAATVDESVYNLKVLQVETLFAKIRESRTMMLYRFYRDLTPDQYGKLQDVFARRSARNGRGRGPSAQ